MTPQQVMSLIQRVLLHKNDMGPKAFWVAAEAVRAIEDALLAQIEKG
jgi:hypothetical protein